MITNSQIDTHMEEVHVGMCAYFIPQGNVLVSAWHESTYLHTCLSGFVSFDVVSELTWAATLLMG